MPLRINFTIISWKKRNLGYSAIRLTTGKHSFKDYTQRLSRAKYESLTVLSTVCQALFTCGVGKPLSDFLLQLQHCHALHLLLSVAQVDDHLLASQSMNHDLVDFPHFVMFLCAGCFASLASVAEC